MTLETIHRFINVVNLSLDGGGSASFDPHLTMEEVHPISSHTSLSRALIGFRNLKIITIANVTVDRNFWLTVVQCANLESLTIEQGSRTLPAWIRTSELTRLATCKLRCLKLLFDEEVSPVVPGAGYLKFATDTCRELSKWIGPDDEPSTEVPYQSLQFLKLKGWLGTYRNGLKSARAVARDLPFAVALQYALDPGPILELAFFSSDNSFLFAFRRASCRDRFELETNCP
ncbi:hypothetical protein T439DRAFT_354875 [Meredithblackwellia eburnea MCA 4105]